MKTPAPPLNATPEHTAAQAEVCIVGLGYIGLPTAALLANAGIRVHGVDKNPAVVDAVQSGRSHIHEPGLDKLLADAVGSGLLTASDKPTHASTYLICVPTPLRDGERPDVSYVEAAAQSLRPWLQTGALVLLESTSPPGTTSGLVAPIATPEHLEPGVDVHFAYCPERVIPGKTLDEMINNDRVVGGVSPESTDLAVRFYQQFIRGQVWPTDATTAELVKLSENAFRDVNIAYANELSMLVEKWGADAREVIQLANRHPRVQILQPGPGVGGHCISVDPWFLAHEAHEQTPLIRTARAVNDSKPRYVADQIRSLASRHGVKKVGCLGLAYKADIDDTRESPSLEIAQLLKNDAGLDVVACDPYLSCTQFEGVPLAPLHAVLRNCELLALLTDHTEFRNLPPRVLATKVLLDTRGCWDQAAIADQRLEPIRRAA